MSKKLKQKSKASKGKKKAKPVISKWMPISGLNFYPGQKLKERILVLGEYLMKKDRYLWTGGLPFPWLFNIVREIWEHTGRDKILVDVTEILALIGESNPRTGELIVKHICRSTKEDISIFTKFSHRIKFQNGVYDTKTFKFYPGPHPEEYHTQALPWVYDLKATCSKIDKLLSENLPKLGVMRVEEFVGTCLLKQYIWPVILIFLGVTGSGKTVIINLISHFLGEENCSSLSLRQIPDRFLGIEMFGVLANICDDISVKDIEHESSIKKSTGDSWMVGQKKHQDPVRFKSHAKQLQSCNLLPSAPKASDAFFKRVLFVDFLKTFGPGDPGFKDRDVIFAETTTPEEMSGFLNKAIAGLKRVRKQSGFTGDNMTPNEKKIDWKRRVSQSGSATPSPPSHTQAAKKLVYQFVELYPRHAWPMSRKRAYRVFVKRCKKRSIKLIPPKKLFEQILAKHPYVSETVGVTKTGVKVKGWNRFDE